MPRHTPALAAVALLVASFASSALAQTLSKTQPAPVEYQTLATSKTSTMQKELGEAAARGFRLAGVMGGGTLAGSEVVVILAKDPDAPAQARYEYRLLATSKTSTMQKELQAAGDAGFAYKGQSVFNTAFGGDEVVVILERDLGEPSARYEYRLLATTKTSTMQKELKAAGAEGFEFDGVTVSKTAFGGEEVVTILHRRAD